MEKVPKKFLCGLCDYECFKKSLFDKHILTLKHKILQNPTQKDPKDPKKVSKIFYCNFCNYECCKKSLYDRHLLTSKHKNTIIHHNKKDSNNSELNKEKVFLCICGKEYKHSSTLYNHKKNCIIINNNSKINNENIFEILKQNQEFKELIMEQNKIIMDFSKNYNVINNNTNNINSHNKTFNLQVFLNEKCKDALNISDFVNSLKLTLEDLENVGDKGFVNGITKIFVNGLKKLDIYKRPIHCSDLKRETMYLKNENVWEKDNDDKENMKKVIKQIANKNINKIYEWKDKYPDCKYSDSKKNDQYSRIIIESMGARTIEEDQVLYEKIIKNIAKETVIDKTK